MATQKQAVDGLLAFVEAELLPAFSGGAGWIASFALGYAREHAAKGDAGLLGAADAEGTLDVDGIITLLKETARKRGKLHVRISDLLPAYSLPGALAKVPLFGDFAEVEFMLGEAEFESLRGYIAKAGEAEV